MNNDTSSTEMVTSADDAPAANYTHKAIPKPSSIPRPQTTPTKTNSQLTAFGYQSPSLNSPKREARSISESFGAAGTLRSADTNRQTLDSLRASINEKETELSHLKNQILDITTQVQQLEVDNQELETSFDNISREVKHKMNEIDNIEHEKLVIQDEFKKQLELKLKKMDIDLASSRYTLDRNYMSEINNVMELKVKEIQHQKVEVQNKIKAIQEKVDNNKHILEQSLSELEKKFSKEQLKITEHMAESRKTLEDELKDLVRQRGPLQDRLDNLRNTTQLIQTKEKKEQEFNDTAEQNKENYKRIKTLRADIEQQQLQLQLKKDRVKDLKHEIESKTKAQEEHERILIEEELRRRKLHDRMQDLKGNIRVFCRIRPPLPKEDDDLLEIKVPNNDEEDQLIEIKDPKSSVPSSAFSTGDSSIKKVQSFRFNRVFQMDSSNAEIFEEISQLAQSALNGFNVCVFAYGQTGSGKTHTMSSEDGMIPRVIDQIFETLQKQKKRGWSHKVYGEFLEIYNENIIDLLGNPQNIDKMKYEIRHDTTTQTTTITDLSAVEVTSAKMMNELLQKALQNRSIAATKANERSSRSHTVFIIRIVGVDSETGETVRGTLNLIDLAGSERLSHSQVSGDRLKETQSINKSLSCLGDVIFALNDGSSRTHIPFRNSKLTYLLQYSLSGNSKTLMFVNISPLSKHFNETVNSLRFATKVNSTKLTNKE